MGIRRDVLNLEIPLVEQNLELYQQGVDNLHNLVGACKELLNQEMQRKKFHKSLFLQELKDEIGKNEIAKFCGRGYRLLICNNKIIIRNSNRKAHTKAQLSELWDNLAELQYYMYTKPSAQKIPEIRLRVHVICFKIRKLIPLVYKKLISQKSAAGFLYIHNLTTEVPKFYQYYDFANSSTEKGESFFAWAKRVAKSFTDRKINSRTIMEILLRWHRVFHSDQNDNGISKAFFRNHVFKEFELPYQDFEHLIFQLDLTEMGYKPYFSIENGSLIFNTLGAIEQYIKGE